MEWRRRRFTYPLRNIHSFIHHALKGYKTSGHRLQPDTPEWISVRNILRVCCALGMSAFSELPGKIEFAEGQIAEYKCAISDEYFQIPGYLGLQP